jgi:hypothetical protein
MFRITRFFRAIYWSESRFQNENLRLLFTSIRRIITVKFASLQNFADKNKFPELIQIWEQMRINSNMVFKIFKTSNSTKEKFLFENIFSF